MTMDTLHHTTDTTPDTDDNYVEIVECFPVLQEDFTTNIRHHPIQSLAFKAAAYVSAEFGGFVRVMGLAKYMDEGPDFPMPFVLEYRAGDIEARVRFEHNDECIPDGIWVYDIADMRNNVLVPALNNDVRNKYDMLDRKRHAKSVFGIVSTAILAAFDAAAEDDEEVDYLAGAAQDIVDRVETHWNVEATVKQLEDHDLPTVSITFMNGDQSVLTILTDTGECILLRKQYSDHSRPLSYKTLRSMFLGDDDEQEAAYESEDVTSAYSFVVDLIYDEFGEEARL